MTGNRAYRIILSGGGTGGHVYPAIAVAKRLVEKYPSSVILFVGASGKMEMEKVPQEGFEITGLPVAGLHREFTLRNLLFPFKLVASLVKARSVIKSFKPDIVVGFGGYASGPLLWMATRKKIPAVIQEQNSYAGLTNRLLARRINQVCVAYEGMEKYFPADKLVHTGNPVRKDILSLEEKRDAAYQHFGFSKNKKTLFIMGGSLGARTINRCVLEGFQRILEKDIQLIWQMGKIYYDDYSEKIRDFNQSQVRSFAFIREMDLAYAVSDLVVSRAGALSVSELCVAKKAVVLVPSPNVAEDHQSKNAESLVRQEAAILISDNDAPEKLISTCIEVMHNETLLNAMRSNIGRLAKRTAADDIVQTIINLLH